MVVNTLILTLVLSLTLTSGQLDEPGEQDIEETVDDGVPVVYVDEEGRSTTTNVLVQGNEVQVSTANGVDAVLDYEQDDGVPVVYVDEEGRSTRTNVLVQGNEVQVSTADGVDAVLDYEQNMLTMKQANDKTCISVLLDKERSGQLPTLEEVQKLLLSGEKMKAPDGRMELKLTQAESTLKVQLSPLSARLCGETAPLLFRSSPVDKKVPCLRVWVYVDFFTLTIRIIIEIC